MSLLAATQTPPSALERLSQIPSEFWIRTGLAIVVVVAVVLVLRKVAKVNKVVLGVVIAVGLTIIGFNRIYERNEPPWATPVVQWLGDFFPTKGRKF